MAAQGRTFPAVTRPEVSDPAASGDRISIPAPGDPRCTVRLVLDRVADKWTAVVITILSGGPIGYADLRRAAVGISDKMLAQTLRSLERDGLVERTVHVTRPIRVSYALTGLGATIVPPLIALVQWAIDHGPELVASQDAHDEQSCARQPLVGPGTGAASLGRLRLVVNLPR